MLRNLNPLLSPDLLHALASMGHGDTIAIVDANFPAVTCGKRVLRTDGIDASDMLEAVLSLLPLDTFSDETALSMQMVDTPDIIPEAVQDFQRLINEHADNPCQITPCERFAFYEKAKDCYIVLQTGERRLYGNLILTKGVA